MVCIAEGSSASTLSRCASNPQCAFCACAAKKETAVAAIIKSKFFIGLFGFKHKYTLNGTDKM